eukprot:scaffold76166_cov69-Phaeocystis_antarctica.AAC.2
MRSDWSTTALVRHGRQSWTGSVPDRRRAAASPFPPPHGKRHPPASTAARVPRWTLRSATIWAHTLRWTAQVRASWTASTCSSSPRRQTAPRVQCRSAAAAPAPRPGTRRSGTSAAAPPLAPHCAGRGRALLARHRRGFSTNQRGTDPLTHYQVPSHTSISFHP